MIIDHFRVDEALANLKLEKRLENEETPLLDALGAKLGMSFTYILAPPVHQCLLCSKPLKKQQDHFFISQFFSKNLGKKFFF